MTVKVTKPSINVREKLSELDKETGIKGEELLRADTSAEAREALQLDQQLFTDFESTGIDDNATSTAVTIDSAGSVYIGSTSDSGTGYHRLSADGFVRHKRAGEVVAVFDRGTSDGDIVLFRKDGATVGSIYSRFGTTLGINGGTTFTIGSNSNSDTIYIDFLGPPKSVYANPDNTYNLGASSKRWKDLYLGGGVYLGGTGAANLLDDYEEGTWTPAIAGWTGTFVGTYTKIGNTVFYSMNTGTLTGSGSGTLEITGLPFNPDASQATGTVMASFVDFTAETRSINGYSIGGSKLRIYESRDNTGWLALTHAALNSGSSNIFISGTYTTAA